MYPAISMTGRLLCPKLNSQYVPMGSCGSLIKCLLPTSCGSLNCGICQDRSPPLRHAPDCPYVAGLGGIRALAAELNRWNSIAVSENKRMGADAAVVACPPPDSGLSIPPGRGGGGGDHKATSSSPLPSESSAKAKEVAGQVTRPPCRLTYSAVCRTCTPHTLFCRENGCPPPGVTAFAFSGVAC